MALNVYWYPGCCGAGIIHGFYAHMMRAGLEAAVKDAEDRLTGRNQLQAILTGRQYRSYGKQLETLGYKAVDCTINSNSGAQLWLMVKSKRPGKPRKPPKPGPISVEPSDEHQSAQAAETTPYGINPYHRQLPHKPEEGLSVD